MSAADEQLFDEAGQPIPPILMDTSTSVVANVTDAVKVAASPDVKVGDLVVLKHGDAESSPVEVVSILGRVVRVDPPFDISASGASILAVRQIKPKLSWAALPDGQDFGDLVWDGTQKKLTGHVNFHSNVSTFRTMMLTLTLLDDASTVLWQGEQPYSVPSGQTCRRYRQEKASGLSVELQGQGFLGKNVKLQASLTAVYVAKCGCKAASLTLGPRFSPVLAIPSS